jgi:hypothetical protein
LPKTLKLACEAEIDGNSDYITVLKRLLDFYVLVAEHLNLLPVVPET